jgi:2-oxoisovalerate dehydrogenase E1 component alpha subunit
MDDSTQLIGKAHTGARQADSALPSAVPMTLHVPTAPHRPGGVAKFPPFEHAPGDLPCPDPTADYRELQDHAIGLIRVLANDGAASGPWHPQLTPQQLRSGLEVMLRTRHLDARMMTMQRQGRLTFYVSSKGEEASAVASALPYAQGDMLFPSYRQPGLLLVRGMPLVSIMCQLIGNRLDNAKGRQMPVHYSWRAGNVVSISSPVGTQLPQAVGAAMAFAYRGERRVAGGWIGDGTSSQGDFHHALNFASVYRPPCVLHVVDNQWAISTHHDQATGGTTFAARAGAYRLPGLRVDGNDFLAVYAVETWAIERARRGGGPTLIEHVTYRQEAHSTSDDPSQYRADGEAEHWPGGDPVERLKTHLIRQGQWSSAAHDDLNRALEQEVSATFQQAETYGSAGTGHGLPPESLFDDVYENVPSHLQSQREELRAEKAEPPDTHMILPITDHRRAAG